MDEDEEIGLDSDVVTDEIIDKHLLGEEPEDEADDPPKPAPRGSAPDPDDDLDDLDDEDDDEVDEDEDDDEEGDDELDDELEDDEEDESEDDEEDDDEEDDVLEDKVTPEDHERIKKDPSLARIHREMQRAFTQKTTEVATREREVVSREGRVQEFEDGISTPQGMADYLSTLISKRPDIVGAAFEAVATGDNAVDFLVEVGLHKPDVLQRAYERVQELEEDPTEKSRHERDRDQRRRDADLTRRASRLKQRTFDRDVSRLEALASKEAGRLKIDSDEMETVHEKLRLRIRERTNKEDGSVDLSDADVKAVVKQAREELDRIYQRAEKRLGRKRVSDSRDEAKRKARKGKRRGPVRPKSRAPKPPKRGQRFKATGDSDELDQFVDHVLEQRTA